MSDPAKCACSDSCCGASSDCSACMQTVSKIPCCSIPLPLPEEQLKQLVADAKDFALLHGAGMRYKDSYSTDTLSMAPFFLLPSPFPKRDFEKVLDLQPLINKLMHRVAHDHNFLEKCLHNTIKADDFTRRLWEIYTTVREEGVAQPVSLALMRCDVLLDAERCTDPDTPVPLQGRTPLPASSSSKNSCPPMAASHLPRCCAPKQVEVNTIASSFGALAVHLRHLHKYVLGIMGRHDLIPNLPPNLALEELCGAMLAAWDLYARPKAVIMFIVEEVAYNICDQRYHEYELIRQRPTIRVLRRTLTQVFQQGRLDDQRRLWLDGEHEVAVVYFRFGYDPSCYHGDQDWQARLLIERSTAIKSPSIHYHLAGTKKVQQELAAEGALLQFLSPAEAAQVSELFTGLYSLDVGQEGDKVVAMALQEPGRFVLKPQREGGGNNLYGDDLKKTLEEVGHKEDREAYILMERIRAPVQQNYLVRPHAAPLLASVMSELGIFGAVLGTATDITLNKTCGHMLRSKLASNNEGGVSSGNGALDSVLLVDT